MSYAVRSYATVRHPPGSYVFGPEMVWTNGTTGDIFIPLSDPMPSANIVNARVLMEVTDNTGGTNLLTRPALRYSEDGVGWDADEPINTTYQASGGIQAGTTFVDLTALSGVTPKPWVQFGVELHNASAGAYELAHATLIVEPKGR